MNPYMAYPQLTPCNVHTVKKAPIFPAPTKWDDEFDEMLSEFFSRFGEVQKICKFTTSQGNGFILVRFACTSAAMNAANSTGCQMFGFCAVRVNLNEYPC